MDNLKKYASDVITGRTKQEIDKQTGDQGDIPSPKANLNDNTFKTSDNFEGGTRAERDAAYQRRKAKGE